MSFPTHSARWLVKKYFCRPDTDSYAATSEKQQLGHGKAYYRGLSSISGFEGK